MTITPQVKRQFFAHNGNSNQVIRLPPAAVASPIGPNRRVGKPWTREEHERFLEGLQMFPNGPWRHIANHVGTRTSRQTMTHAQKYRERISRQLVQPPRLAPQQPTLPAMHTSEIVRDARPHFDELDHQILACLLDTDDDASGSSSSDQDDYLGPDMPDSLFRDMDDLEMRTLLSELDVGNGGMPMDMAL